MEASYTEKHYKKKAPAPSTEKVFLGKRFEQEAQRHYENLGYLLIAKNLHLGWAEIDLLFLFPKKNALMLVEVRGRSSNDFKPAQMLSPVKKKRLEKVGSYLSQKYLKAVNIQLCEITIQNQKMVVRCLNLY